MRQTLTFPTLFALGLLSACTGSATSGGPDNANAFYPNCAAQAELAQNGRTDGREITITCP